MPRQLTTKGSQSSGVQRGKPTFRSRAYRSQNQRRSNYVTKLSLNGGKIEIPQNPPEVTYQPWNQATIVHTFTGELSFQVKDILNLLKNQLDPTKRGFNQTTSGDGRFVVQLRFFSIKVWNLTGRVVSLSVDDYLDSKAASGGREQLCGIVDTGHNNSIPAAGYLLPSSHRQHVVRVDDQEEKTYVFHSQVGASDNGIVYVHLAYRFDGPVHPPLIFTPIAAVLQQQDYQIAEAQNSNSRLATLSGKLTKIHKLLSNYSEKGPSVVKKVVEGVEQAALLVSLLGEEDADSLASEFSTLGLAEVHPHPSGSRADAMTELGENSS